MQPSVLRLEWRKKEGGYPPRKGKWDVGVRLLTTWDRRLIVYGLYNLICKYIDCYWNQISTIGGNSLKIWKER